MVSVPTTESLDFLGQASAKCTTVVKSEKVWIKGTKSSFNREECTQTAICPQEDLFKQMLRRDSSPAPGFDGVCGYQSPQGEHFACPL